MGARIRFLTVRRSAALAVAALGLDALLSGVASDDPHRQSLLGSLTPPDLPSELQVLSVIAGLALLVIAPRLWRGTRTAVSLAVGGLTALVTINILTSHWDEAVLEILLAVLLALGRRSFRIGSRNRPQLAIVCAALAAWALAYLVMRFAPLVPSHAGHSLLRALHHSVARGVRFTAAGGRLSPAWGMTIEGLMVAAAGISAFALRSLTRPAPSANQHDEHEYRLARAILDCHGEDSLSPFILRPDKALHLGAGGVLSYRVIRGTAVISSDPVAPEDGAPAVLESFTAQARKRGWRIALWAASERHLDAYRALGLKTICVGEEAFVDPRRFTLEGRKVRKLRQSVHRIERRGWMVSSCEGRDVDGELELEMHELEITWRTRQRRLHGFAMGMGKFDAELRPDDIYILARAPDGRLGAVMRFVSHCGKLSLDTMHRVGASPNGLNETMVCEALMLAKQREVLEVSLNYAGLAHLVRGEPVQGRLARAAIQAVMAPLGRRFQMERLVRFNDKFSPTWRPRYLVYESAGLLPRAVLRVLQVEGYLPEPRRRLRIRLAPTTRPRPVPRSPHAGQAG